MREKTNSNKNVRKLHTNLRNYVTEWKNFLKETSSIQLFNKAAKDAIKRSKIFLKCLVDNTYQIIELKGCIFEVNCYITGNILDGSRAIPPWTIAPDNSHLEHYPLDNCFPKNSHRHQLRIGQLPLGKFPPRTITPGQLPPENSHRGQLYCPRITAPWQLLPRAKTITHYNFFLAIFCFFSMAQLYNFCYDNKNNNDNRNKTWSSKLLSVIIL